jgi:hypothetical protein
MEKNQYIPLNRRDFEVVRRQSNESNKSERSSRKSFHIPDKLKRTFYCSLSLLLLGIFLLVVGIFRWVIIESFNEGASFFALSTIILIPGIFYTYQFCKARLTKDRDSRREIMNDIPEL